MKMMTRRDAAKLALKLHPRPDNREMVEWVQNRLTEDNNAKLVSDLIVRGVAYIYGEQETVVIRTIPQLRKYFTGLVLKHWASYGAFDHCLRTTKEMIVGPLDQIVYTGENA